MLKYNTCAHARPGLRPFVPLDCKDHGPVFPVAPCCTRSVRYKMAEPRSYCSALPDRDRCESCPTFTDPDTLVHIQADTFRADIYLDRLCDMTIHNLKKLFRLAKKAQFENEAAIQSIRSYFDEVIPEAQETMRTAAKAYEDGWRKVDKPRSRNPKTVEQLRLNKELTVRFKQAHARYERLVASRKVFEETLFPDTKHPMN